jgi:hypothetical protein
MRRARPVVASYPGELAPQHKPANNRRAHLPPSSDRACMMFAQRELQAVVSAAPAPLLRGRQAS